jgi:hypothetical protein
MMTPMATPETGSPAVLQNSLLDPVPVQALVAHLEDPELVVLPKRFLLTSEACRATTVPGEHQDHVHHVLQQLGPAMEPCLVICPMMTDGTAVAFDLS